MKKIISSSLIILVLTICSLTGCSELTKTSDLSTTAGNSITEAPTTEVLTTNQADTERTTTIPETTVDVSSIALSTDNLQSDFDAWEHVGEKIKLVGVDVRKDETPYYNVAFNSMQFPAESDTQDMSELRDKKIDAIATVIYRDNVVENQSGKKATNADIIFKLDSINVLGTLGEPFGDYPYTWEPLNYDSESDDFLVGQVYYFQAAHIESEDAVYDTLYYDSVKNSSIQCIIDPDMVWRVEDSKTIYNNELSCWGVVRGSASNKYIVITWFSFYDEKLNEKVQR